MNENEIARMDRVAVFVPDVDAAAEEFERIFGWKMTVFDVEGMDIRVALCEEGLELVQGNAPVEKAGRMAGVGIRVRRLDDAVRKRAEAGDRLKYKVETPGGLLEYSYSGMGGLPMVLYAF